MIDDRELLEIAAKAAGIEIEPCTCSDPKWPFRLKPNHGFGHWNQLADDGDALRLAADLRIRIVFRPAVYADTPTGIRFFGRDFANNGSGLYARVRYAIVRAAARAAKEQS